MNSTSGTEAELRRRIRRQEVVAELGRRALEADDLDALLGEAATAEPLPRVRGDETSTPAGVPEPPLVLEHVGDGPPRIHVGATRSGDRWEVSVRDEGIGIDPETRERIFEVFEPDGGATFTLPDATATDRDRRRSRPALTRPVK